MLNAVVEEKQLTERPFWLHAAIKGEGTNVIIAFHGFGQDGSVYGIFNKLLDHSHQLHSFDLPFHGKSQITGKKEGINRDQFRSFFIEYFEKNRISSFTLIGFSIGAKFALNLVHFFPEKIKRLILIAPDGLKINFWYNMATNNRFSRLVFRYSMDHPQLFIKFSEMLTSLRIIHPAVSRFVRSQVEDDHNRKLIYNSWVNYRTLNLDIHELGRLIQQTGIPVEIFLGEKDRLINVSVIRPMIRELPHAKVHILPTGHSRLIEDTAEFYEKNGF